MKMKKFFSLEWDAIAGIVAAVAATVLHLLHMVDEHVILPIVLVLMTLLFINFIRHTKNNEATAEQVSHTAHAVSRIHSGLKPPEVILIGPRHLRSANEQFLRHMSGDAVLYNVCLSMYKAQPLFDTLLRPLLDNPMVASIQFVLDESQRDLWRQSVLPKIAACAGCAKVMEPRWRSLSKNISFILADNQLSKGTEALLCFWGEPFMAQTIEQDKPRFCFHVQMHSELLPHLAEMARRYVRVQYD
jgi:hypothetical protein